MNSISLRAALRHPQFRLGVKEMSGVSLGIAAWGLVTGVAMVKSGLSVPLALFIGTVGAVSVFKAVYIDKRELKCACVGGSSNVPLGFVSLTENLMMIGMAIWMAVDYGH
jgi:hypothetical protein